VWPVGRGAAVEAYIEKMWAGQAAGTPGASMEFGKLRVNGNGQQFPKTREGKYVRPSTS